MRAGLPDELGIGLVYTPRIAGVLDLGLVDVLEIEPQMFWQPADADGNPGAIDLKLFEQLRGMRQHKLAHSVSLPVGSLSPHDPRELERLRRSVAAIGAPYASEHLSFNQFDTETGRHWTGFLLPPRQDEQGVQAAAARIEEMRRAVGVPVAFETGVNYLRPRPDELSDGRFIRRVAEAADCGILLDLHNLWANARNGRDSVRAVFDEIPRERVWEIHLAGGMAYRGYWLDAHCGRIDDELFDLAREVIDECPNLRAVIFEIMEHYVDERAGDGLRTEMGRLRSLWSGRRRPRPVAVPPPSAVSAEPGADAAAGRRREATLGAAAIGRAAEDVDAALRDDPALPLYADLAASMREGALNETLPFSVRLLILTLGRRATLDLIAAYRETAPPQPFYADEARGFIAHLRARTVPVPHLGDILSLEEARLAVSGTAETRIVTFGCDAAALLAALLEKRSPGRLAAERVEIEVSASGIRFLQPSPGGSVLF